MGIIKSTVKVGEKPPKEVIKRLKQAARRPINYTKEAPRSSPEALKEFAMRRAEMNRQKLRQTISVRLTADCIDTYKALGKGYTGVMADVLKYAAENPSVLTAAMK
jgi:uncharacterized protein (DUF4415 family)